MGNSEEKEYYPGHEYQGLFNLMHEQYGLTLLVSEMQEIVEEVRKMDSQSSTIEQHDTLQGAMEIHRNQKLVEGDWFQGTEEEYRKILKMENQLSSGGQINVWVNSSLRFKFLSFDGTHLCWVEQRNKTQLTPEEFLRRAENTFKNKN